MAYVLYMNRVHRYLTIHTDQCRYPQSQGGLSGTIPPTGWYISGLKSREGAEWARRWLARKTGFRLRPCGACG